MFKGIIGAVSPIGRGKYPKNLTVLIEIEGKGRWFIVDNKIKNTDIVLGPCEFELKNDVISNLKSLKSVSEKKQKKESEDIYDLHVMPFSGLDVFQIAAKINELSKIRSVAATQLQPVKCEDNKQVYDVLIYFKDEKKKERKFTSSRR